MIRNTSDLYFKIGDKVCHKDTPDLIETVTEISPIAITTEESTSHWSAWELVEENRDDVERGTQKVENEL